MLATFWQYLIPQHLLSRLAGWVTNCKIPVIKNWLITRFIRAYGVNMQEAAEPDPSHYATFNLFFTRALRADARHCVTGSQQLACPVDGSISQLGSINNERIFQAKGFDFTTTELLADAALAKQFNQGSFATIYLAPKDYHRIHMPYSGILQKMIYIPGRLFSVNPSTTNHVPSLFARNERVVLVFDTTLGPMVMVLVGAMLVASIHTIWHGAVTPPRLNTVKIWDYPSAGPQAIHLTQGAELGHFELGSTVILLLPHQAARWAPQITADARVYLGQLLADVTTA